MGTLLVVTTSIKWVEVRDAGKHPGQLPRKKSYLAQHISSAQVEKSQVTSTKKSYHSISVAVLCAQFLSG